MTRSLAVLRMNLLRRMNSWYATPIILAGFLAFVLFLRIVVEGTDPAGEIRMHGGGGVALRGFLGGTAASSFATCFPLAIAVGVTRRGYVAGSLLHHLQQAIYGTLLLAGLLALERATGHWFVGQRVFDAGQLAYGGWGTFAWLTPLSLLAIMGVCTSASSAWLWRGMTGLLIYTAAMVAAGIAVLPLWQVVLPYFNEAWLALLLVAVTALGLLATFLITPRISIRGS